MDDEIVDLEQLIEELKAESEGYFEVMSPDAVARILEDAGIVCLDELGDELGIASLVDLEQLIEELKAESEGYFEVMSPDAVARILEDAGIVSLDDLDVLSCDDVLI